LTFAIALCVTQAIAGDVVVVRSTSSTSFNDATTAFVESFTQSYPSHGLTVQDVGQPLERADLVIAMGSKTAGSLTDMDAPILHCMTTNSPQDVPALVLGYPVEKQLELIASAFPKAKRVGVVYSDDASAQLVNTATGAADRYGLRIVEVRIDGPDALNRSLEGLANRVDVLWAVPDATLYSHATKRGVIVFSFRNRLPFFGLSDVWTKAGATIAPSFDHRSIGGQCAQLAGDILDGTPYDEIGHHSPDPMFYSINMNSLKTMKMVTGADLIDKARHVY